MKTQNEEILSFLESGKAINPIMALNMFGCFRLAARIDNLKRQGYTIISETIKKGGKRYAQYRMAV